MIMSVTAPSSWKFQVNMNLPPTTVLKNPPKYFPYKIISGIA